MQPYVAMLRLGSGETFIGTENNRNQRFEKLLKLGGGQKIFIFREGLPYDGELIF